MKNYLENEGSRQKFKPGNFELKTEKSAFASNTDNKIPTLDLAEWFAAITTLAVDGVRLI